MTRIKPADVRYYVDADLLGVARVLARLRSDVTFPGDPGGVVHKRERPACPVTSPASLDTEWIPEVARRGWLILTRDRHIQDRPLELAAVRQHGARLVALTSTDARTVFDQLEVVMCRWRDIERCVDLPAPFIFAATRSSLRSVPLN